MKIKILSFIFLLVVFGCSFSKTNNAEHSTLSLNLHIRATNELTQFLSGYIYKSNDTMWLGNKRYLSSKIRLDKISDFDFVKLGVNQYFSIIPSIGLSAFKAWEKNTGDYPSYSMAVGLDKTMKNGIPQKFMIITYSESGDNKTLSIFTEL